MRDKKGVMGLDTAKAFIIGILTLVILGVLAMVILVQLNSTSLVNPDTNIVTNETDGFVNSTSYTLNYANVGTAGSFAITGLINGTSGLTIPLGNATVSSAGVVTNATEVNWNNVSISYTYQTPSNTQNVITNATSGLSSFYSSTAVWLSLLGVVIIILIIASVVVVVNRFGSNSTRSQPSY